MVSPFRSTRALVATSLSYSSIAVLLSTDRLSHWFVAGAAAPGTRPQKGSRVAQKLRAARCPGNASTHPRLVSPVCRLGGLDTYYFRGDRDSSPGQGARDNRGFFQMTATTRRAFL